MALNNNFAVIGNPISHSLSPVLFKQYVNDTNFAYTRLLLKEINDLESIIKAFNIAGINVTSPFKNDVFQFVDKKSDEANRLNVSNTIIFGEEFNKAYNTDVVGVQKSLLDVNVLKDNSILVIGAGGAAKAVLLALEGLGINDVSIANRTKSKLSIFTKDYNVNVLDVNKIGTEKYDVIINTLPVYIDSFKRLKLDKSTIVFDANYNNKPLLELANKNKSRYIDGINWLIHQGKDSYKLMTGLEGDKIKISNNIKFEIEERAKVISLIGPMGSWKSTVGKKLAEKLNYSFFDIDSLVEEHAKMTVTEIFEAKGEDYFRKMENIVLGETLKKKNIVIATGGGIVKNERNIKLLKKHSWNILLYASPEECFSRIDIKKRPLLIGKDVLKILTDLFNQRKDNYFKTSDLIINTENVNSIEVTDILYEDYSNTFKV